MPITFACQHCDRPYTVADSLAGKKAKCKECGNAMDVPAETPADVPVAAEIVSSAKRPTSTPRRKPSSSSARKAKSTRSKQRRGEKEFGLGELRGTDIFSGSNPSRTPSLDNHAVDPGFAQVTPEEVAYRREAELDAMRNKKPKLEDYLSDDDRLAMQLGIVTGEVDEDDVSWKAVLPAVVMAGLLLIATILGGLFALFGSDGGVTAITIAIIVITGLSSVSGNCWQMMLVQKYHSDEWLLYYFVPFYPLIYTIKYPGINKGPISMWLVGFFGMAAILIMWACGSPVFESS